MEPQSQKTPEDLAFEEQRAYWAVVAPWTVYPFSSVPAIRPWHESDADIRVLAGPNRGGKTTAGAFELVSYACGYNPIRDEHYKTPNICWAVCLTLKAQGAIMLQKLSEMLPNNPDGTPNWTWNKGEGKITVGPPYHSHIFIKQQEDGRESFYGQGCQAIWIDEGKAGETGEENFNEMYIRRSPGIPLKIFLTLTPLNGFDWLWRKLWKEDSEEFIPGTFRHRFSLEDCLVDNGGFLTRKEAAKFPLAYHEFERAARLYGDFTPFGNSPFFSTKLLMEALGRAPKGLRVTPNPYNGKMDPVEDGVAQIFRPRESGHEYIAAWDPASGSGGDSSALVVLDRADLAVVFQAANNTMDPALYAHSITLPVSTYYNEAQLVIEVNGEGGGAALQNVQNYPNLYMQKTWEKQTAVFTDKMGWRTTEPSRHRVMDALSQTLREGKWTPTSELLHEMSHVVVKKTDSGRVRAEHADGFHDDLVMATGIALAVHYEEPVIEWPNWNKVRVRYQQPHEQEALPFS